MKKFKRFIVRSLLLIMLAGVVLSLLLVVPFRWVNPPFTMVMADRWLGSEGDFYLHQQWLDWDEIPKQATLAIVTSEDQKFPHHAGIDFGAIMTALKEASRGGELRGASTISQQVAKNMYLWTGRSWLRKGLEVWFTLLIELTWGKQRILEVYINIAEWGQGVFGLEAASRFYFGKSAAQLTSMQSALLASSLPSPLKYNPTRPAPHLLERANWNLTQQQKLGGTAWLAPLESAETK